MNNMGDKRALENDWNSSTYGSSKKQKLCFSPQKTDTEKNFRLAKGIMARIYNKLRDEHESCSSPTKTLIQYIKKNIFKLDKSVKKETKVGVFGRTGAGKSSLINAILRENDLLPSGTICACTSVIIQVSANMIDSNYTAEIEFISKEEWEDELKTLVSVLKEHEEDRDDSMYKTAKEKILTLYGEEGCSMTFEDLMKDENFSEIPEFLNSSTRKLTSENASELSEQIRCFVQQDDASPGGCYWPVVKSVTIRVPNCKDFLEHIVFVDLPGTGDYSKSRDQMWRSKLKECSIIWIVSEINRAVADKDAWEMVSNSIAHMAHGGECRSISFICTKTDDIIPQNYMRSSKLKDEDLHIVAGDSEYSYKKKSACILHRNNKAKEKVKKNFDQQDTIKKQFKCGDTFFSVFTVSSAQFFEEKPILAKEETEILLLRELLKKYSNSQANDTISQYISGAHGILCLIQGLSDNNSAMIALKSKIYDNLEQNLHNAMGDLREYWTNVCSTMEYFLTNGVTESEEKCIETATKLIVLKDGRGFHRALTALCKNDGYYRSKIGETDLNMWLAQHMYKHIDNEFCDLFIAYGNTSEKSLQEKIETFTIVPADLITKYEHSPVLCHLLKFLKTEQSKLKTILKCYIINQKKDIYSSLSESIQTTMRPCYKKASACSGIGSLKQKQEIILHHINSHKYQMFHDAKQSMQNLLDKTMDYIDGKTKETLMDSMHYALLNANTFPYMDISREVEEMKRLSADAMD